jgi:N-acyl-D-aspartate/D-glutamate deacylase
MELCETLIKDASVLDGSGADSEMLDIAIRAGRICAIGTKLQVRAESVVDAQGLVLSPGFIDTHTHDDIELIRNPGMLAKVSQGVTTVIVGNCGISASPVQLRSGLPDPMNLLGDSTEFVYPTFAAYLAAIETTGPAVNVGALVGHTALRNNHMEQLDRAASADEISAMRGQLSDALDDGALGLSSGLAYLSANAAPTEEVLEVARPLTSSGGLYVTHMRSESAEVLDAMKEAFVIGRERKVAVVISHLKCAGIDNWGRGNEVLGALIEAQKTQPAACDCYPYAAGSSTLDVRQVDPRIEITVTWSTPHPEMGGRSLGAIADEWNLTQLEAARRLQPAGAIYHSISEEDLRRILAHPATMIGSDGLPCDPRPHPRLWGTFPRVLGHFCRNEMLFSLPEAIRKMTGMPAQRFGFADRGLIREGFCADLVLFDPKTIIDTATFFEPVQTAVGIECVWVNGVLTYNHEGPTGRRAGQFLKRARTTWMQ